MEKKISSLIHCDNITQIALKYGITNSLDLPLQDPIASCLYKNLIIFFLKRAYCC